MSQELSTSKKRVYITAEQKLELCKLKKNKPEPKNIELANQFGISTSQVSDILKESDKWLKIEPGSYQARLKRPSVVQFINVEEALILWIEKALECNLTITDLIIKQKGMRFAELLNIQDFSGSSGWLSNFKQRYSIREYFKHGEAQSAPIEQLPEMRRDLQNILKEYQLDNIFNCDETGLFWKMEPSRGLSTGPLSGVKKDKDRITVLLTCNATGSEKLVPLLIHKYQTPRSLRGIDKKTLPVDYYWNSKAWMQVSIWNDYLRKLDKRMKAEKRNIILLVDNAPTHSLTEDLRLTNIRVHYFPPNVTAHLQPCDAGIIHSFKVS